MDKYLKNPRIQAALGLAVIILLGLWLAKSPTNDKQKEEKQEEQKTEQAQTPQTSKPAILSSPNMWEGMLKISDEPKKGNLMLLTEDKKIYLKTNRDFSLLLDKVVSVTYEGTLDSFRLGDIVEKAPQNSEAGN
jgi:hypothetical protein